MRVIFAALALAFATTSATAQTGAENRPIPDRHVAISRDRDFYGSDLQTMFDTSLDACQAACLDDGQCRAFTFNQRSSACFLKGGVTQVSPYEGAISGRIVDTAPEVLTAMPDRREELDFLDAYDVQRARDLADGIGRLHSSDEFTAAELLDAATARRSSGDLMAALRFTGAAVALQDRADLWLEYGRLARTATSSDADEQATARGRALPALVNAYLRAGSPNLRATVLYDLAQALEGEERGSTTIPALRLAQMLDPRRDAEAALDRAIGLYGFRIETTEVESDSATPRICARFTEPLVQAGVDYGTYVQLPDDALTVEVEDQSLCIDGVEHGERYRVVFREGLPAASGESLVRPVEVTLYVRDRAPGVRFTSRAYVLPNTGAAAIPVETVNLDAVDLTLSRVSDRNLLRAMQEDLFNQPLYAWTADYFDDQIGDKVWTGSASVAQELNRDILTRLPLDEALAGQAPGIYVLTATVPGADPYDVPPASQWFVLSDLGIATMSGTDGLMVSVRSLGDASAKPGTEVTLLSRANAVLGSATTDGDGVARFDAGLTRGTGGAAPGLVTVTDGAADLAFLSLTDPAFDLSDRGVEGREPAGPIDVFLTPDRGAYRAGETVNLTALMRDPGAHALSGVPLTAIFYRPDGVEYSRQASTEDRAGGHVFHLPVAATAPRGTWRVEVKSDLDAPALADTELLVEDFLPERIDFTLGLPDRLALGDLPELTLDARYLFGPPAGDLPVEGEVILSAADSVEGFPGYVFGLYDEPLQTRVESFGGGMTDAAGRATVALPLPEVEGGASQPLSATVVARISEGSGRPVERRETVAVAPDGPMIGIRPAFDGVVSEGGTARFDIVGLSPDLTPAAMNVRWTLNRVETRYQWYQMDGNWNWEPVTDRTRVATGEVKLGDGPATVEAAVDWGRYELVVERTGPGWIAASTDFYAGWYAPADAGATPDLLEASLDSDAYAIGDTARFRMVPRYAGTAIVTVMTDRVVAMQAVPVTEGENVIDLPVTEDWGAGAYVTATVIRPMDVAEGHGAARALGLAYAGVAPGDRQLSVTIEAPEASRPRERLDAAVHVEGLAAGETAWVTLAAVDVGILNLTGFDSPDPSAYYFGQRKLGVEIRDIYGRLIDNLNGAMGTVRSGGDAGGMQTDAPPPTEDLVAFFTGPIEVGPDGRATAGFELPSFNGTVRLMAVAWSQTGVGQDDADVLVRDPVVVTASIPRFLAPGDESRLLLELVHAEGPVGDVTVSVEGDGIEVVTPARLTATLPEGGRWERSLSVIAGETGLHEIVVTVTTPDGIELEKTLTIPVEVNDPEVARVSRFSLAAGETFTFDDQVFAGLIDGTGSATLSVGPLARFDAPGLLNALDRYPYGCTEQIASRALPLLYFDEVAQAMGLADRDEVSERIDQAILAVLGNQAASGAFGLWGPYPGDLWLDAYVTDFLSRARARGHAVPETAFSTAIDNLRNRVNYAPDFEEGGEDIAYALMVLAREGEAAVGDLRYYADERTTAFTTPMAAAQLGAALAFYGDQLRADTMFRRAGDLIAAETVETNASIWRADYGTPRRDRAAVLALATEAGSEAIDRVALALRVSSDIAGQPSTQEAAWTLLAADALIDDLRQTGLTIDGQPPSGPLVRLREADADAAPVQVANGGDGPTEVTVTTFGVPAEPEPAGGNGYSIRRAWYTLEGEETLPDAVAAGTRLVTVLTVTPFGRQEARLMVNDPLPAGFEIDNPNLLRGGDLSALDWLDTAAAENAQFRQERFLAAVDWRSDQPFRLAYIVRAVSPGTYHLPAASVEDMYRPQMRARTDAGTVTVTP